MQYCTFHRRHFSPVAPVRLLIFMPLLKYFKSKNGLPDLRGELSSVISPRQIALANKGVEAELTAA